MESYIITFLGILVSVGLFLIGYRQTVGHIKNVFELQILILKRLF
jgi:hypothetical protein